MGALGERTSGGGADGGLVVLAECSPCGGAELGVIGDALVGLGPVERPVELSGVDLHHDPPVHREQPCVGPVREPGVTRRPGDAAHGAVVQPQVEDRVHHPRHREPRPGAHRNQKWVLRGAERPAHALLESGDVTGQLGIEPLRPPTVHVGGAGRGRDREPGRNRQPEDRRHLGEVRALSAQQRRQLTWRAAVTVVEGVDVRHARHARDPWRRRLRPKVTCSAGRRPLDGLQTAERGSRPPLRSRR